MRNRLAVVVKLKQCDEDRKLGSLAQTLQRLKAAQAAVEAEHRLTQVAHAPVGTAADWAISDGAHGQALARLKKARQLCGAAETEVTSAQGDYAQARGRTESVRRLDGIRQLEHRLEANKREDRSLDELSLLGFARRAKGKTQG